MMGVPAEVMKLIASVGRLNAAGLLAGGPAELEHVDERRVERLAEGLGDGAVLHLEIAPHQADDVEQLRGGRGALLVGLRRPPVGDRLVEERRQLLRRDERVDLGDDQQPSAGEERQRPVRIEDRRQLRPRLEHLDGDPRVRRDDGIADVVEGLFGEVFGGAADEKGGGEGASLDLGKEGGKRLRH